MSPEPNRNSRRILVADDDPVMRRVIDRILTDAGYRVVQATDGRAAYRILQADDDFRAAILDLRMPQLEGIDIIRCMQTDKRLMRIPVILMTADQGLAVQSDSFAAGALALLLKPFTTNNVQTVLRLLGDSEDLGALKRPTQQPNMLR